MKMFDEQLQSQLREVLAGIKDDVHIALFTKEGECYSCAETKGYMSEVAELNDKIHLETYDINKDAELAKTYRVEMVPSIVLLDAKKNYRGVKFNGIPAGHEINSFIPALLEVSGQTSEVPQDIMDRISKIDKPVNIKVFVTLSCPHCAGAVQKAHKMALMNSNIDAEMIEAETFDELSNKFNVSGV
ncbi:MAG TPA: thioredoxin family protein, partial [Clostridiaceae bacterium]|nr:thioredoxin family protein [Clostridiaceae bacterium]